MEQKKKDYSKYTKKYWRTQIKHRAVRYLGGICRHCGQVLEDCCYDFHHLDPKEKDFAISAVQTNGARSWFKIRDELKKCILLCANCHRLIHAGLIETDIQSYFNNEYYEWDLTNYKTVDTKSGVPKTRDTTCPKCGKYKSPNASQCLDCSKKERRGFEISREDLKGMIYNDTFVNIGKKFNVSDNCIRRRCKELGLPFNRKDIAKYSLEEWMSV